MGRAPGGRRAAAQRPHHHPDAPASPPAQHHRDPRPRPRPARRHAPRRAARVGRAARGRRPPRRHRGPHRGVVRRPRAHPCPRHLRDRRRRDGARRAHRDDVRRPREGGRQRDRRLGRRPRRAGPAAAQPRHPPRPARVGAAAHPGRGDGADPGHDVALRDGAAPAGRHDLRRPHRRARDRTGARRARAQRGRDRLPARGRGLGVHHTADEATTSSAPSPACGRCSRSPARTRRPTCPAVTPSSRPPPA